MADFSGSPVLIHELGEIAAAVPVDRPWIPDRMLWAGDPMRIAPGARSKEM
jgi:hypothetical protein